MRLPLNARASSRCCNEREVNACCRPERRAHSAGGGPVPGGRLTQQDRRQIAAGLADDLSYTEIAKRLERPTSTITREVMRNGGPTDYRGTGRTTRPYGVPVAAGRRRPCRHPPRRPTCTGAIPRHCGSSSSGSRTCWSMPGSRG
ncbi:helix-turn-helix domain-containing protein [Streptomyces sp. MS1.HAVA.3]|uniref:Helix-turn-helix domain-containing protein n=1 Tax=Streptomyces caledonius TaxID=3134107 RepID=A0ABU8U9P9_9ACTN